MNLISFMIALWILHLKCLPSLCKHQIIDGLWGAFCWATFIIINAGGMAWGGSLSLDCDVYPTNGAPLLTLVSFGGTGNFSSGITLCHNISLFCQHLASSGVDTTYGLRVFSPGVDVTVASCHRLTLGSFCSHTGCWGRSGGSSLAWASCPVYSCLLRKAASLL